MEKDVTKYPGDVKKRAEDFVNRFQHLTEQSQLMGSGDDGFYVEQVREFFDKQRIFIRDAIANAQIEARQEGKEEREKEILQWIFVKINQLEYDRGKEIYPSLDGCPEGCADEVVFHQIWILKQLKKELKSKIDDKIVEYSNYCKCIDCQNIKTRKANKNYYLGRIE